MKDELDIDAEMKKQPEDRAPGTLAALLRGAFEFGGLTPPQEVLDNLDEVAAEVEGTSRPKEK